MEYRFLTEENYPIIIELLDAIQKKGLGEYRMFSEHGFAPAATDAAMARRDAERNGLDPEPYWEEPIILTKEEAQAIVKKLGGNEKSDDLKAAMLAGVK